MADQKASRWKHPGGKLRRMGPSALSERELLAIILGSGTNGKSALKISDEILDTYANLRGLMGVPLKELMKIKGLKEVKATKIASMYEASRRILKHIENDT